MAGSDILLCMCMLAQLIASDGNEVNSTLKMTVDFQLLPQSTGPSTITGLDQWTGLVDWIGGLTLKIIFMLFNKA